MFLSLRGNGGCRSQNLCFSAVSHTFVANKLYYVELAFLVSGLQLLDITASMLHMHTTQAMKAPLTTVSSQSLSRTQNQVVLGGLINRSALVCTSPTRLNLIIGVFRAGYRDVYT